MKSCQQSKISPLVAFEGVDGSGKSSVARAFGEREGFCFVPIASAYIVDPMRGYLSFEADHLEKALVYAASLLGRLATARRQTNAVAVLDRSLWSTLALLTARAPKETVVQMRAVFDVLGLETLLPTWTVVLDTPYEICRARIAQRTTVERRHDTMAVAEYERHMAYYRGIAADPANRVVMYTPHVDFSPAQTAEDIYHTILKGVL